MTKCCILKKRLRCLKANNAPLAAQKAMYKKITNACSSSNQSTATTPQGASGGNMVECDNFSVNNKNSINYNGTTYWCNEDDSDDDNNTITISKSDDDDDPFIFQCTSQNAELQQCSESLVCDPSSPNMSNIPFFGFTVCCLNYGDNLDVAAAASSGYTVTCSLEDGTYSTPLIVD